MRVLIMAKEGEQRTAAAPPTAEAMAEHQKFNEELVKAGVVVGSGRLAPSSESRRVRFDGMDQTSMITGTITGFRCVISKKYLPSARRMLCWSTL